MRDTMLALLVGCDCGRIGVPIIDSYHKVSYGMLKEVCNQLHLLAARAAVICICWAMIVSNSDFLMERKESAVDAADATDDSMHKS